MEVTAGEFVGVDIGGTGVKGGLVDVVAGKLVGERIRVPTPQPATPEAVAGVVNEVLGQLEGEAPAGITLPAVVRGTTVETASNIDEAWIGIDAVALFRAATGRAVTVVNDADAAGIAEVRFGAGRDRPGVIVVITLGTGIGSALFVDGLIVPNTELGHLHLHHGDAEDWAAASVRENDALSWKEWGSRLDRYLQLVERLLWPQLIILGGGVSKKSGKFLPLLNLRTEVVPAELENDAGIVGAAMFAPSLPDPA